MVTTALVPRRPARACFRTACFFVTVASLALAPSAAARGNVLTVDAGGGADFAILQDAIDAAADGDTLLVAGGQYVQAVVDGKSLSIVAEAGAKVTLVGSIFGADVVAVRNLAFGQRVVLRGLDVVPAVQALERVVHLQANDGGVWIEDMTVTGTGPGWVFDASVDPDAMVVAEDSDTIHFARLDVTGNAGVIKQPSTLTFLHESSPGADALRVAGSRVSLWDSALTGGLGSTATFGPTNAPIPATVGGDGVRVDSGELFVSGSTLTGGQGGGANVFYWGCLFAADGGRGLALGAGGPTVTLLDTAPAGGAGGPMGICSPAGQPGADTDLGSGSLSELDGDARSFESTSPHREGESSTFTYSGLPGDVAFDLIGTAEPFALLLEVNGMLAVAPLVIRFAGTLDGTGSLVVAQPVPPFGDPSVETADVFLQAAFVELAGGSATAMLGFPSALTLFDAVF